ncbi:MAG: transglutaminase family protein [Niabella sp.]
MNDNGKEVTALLNLIEDPDPTVFEAVCNRIISYGSPIIPELENLWENTADNEVLERIEQIIHRLHYNDITEDFRQWAISPHQELLPGALLVAKFLYPNLHAAKVIQDVERLKRNIWLELNNYLTPLEQITVFNNIFYNYFGLRGDYNQTDKPNEFLVNKIIESKKGNQTGNGILYLILAEMLDIPVKYIPVPNQFVLAYFKSRVIEDVNKLHLNIEFFIDPVTGQAFTHTDITHYFNRASITVEPSFFIPSNNKQVIQKLLTDFAKCYYEDHKKYMQDEINQIVTLLNK